MPCMLNRTALFSLLALAAVGCASQTRTYDIIVHNNSTKPLTLVLAKSAGPAEAVWMSPEDIMNAAPDVQASWGLGTVPAGKTATASNVKGTFPKGADAFLRVYAGDLTLGEMLKVTAGSPDRIDLTLQPGKNDLVVVDQDSGIMLAGPEGATTQPTTQPTTEATAAPTTETTTAPTTAPAP